MRESRFKSGDSLVTFPVRAAGNSSCSFNLYVQVLRLDVTSSLSRKINELIVSNLSGTHSIEIHGFFVLIIESLLKAAPCLRQFEICQFSLYFDISLN